MCTLPDGSVKTCFIYVKTCFIYITCFYITIRECTQVLIIKIQCITMISQRLYNVQYIYIYCCVGVGFVNGSILLYKTDLHPNILEKSYFSSQVILFVIVSCFPNKAACQINVTSWFLYIKILKKIQQSGVIFHLTVNLDNRQRWAS